MIQLSGDAIGRHLHVAAFTHRRQRRQRRLAKQHLHIGAQPGLAHALYQLHGEQRVPAQFKEMVVTAHLLHLQQLGPELGEDGFHTGSRRFEPASDERRLGRCRQCLAVEFAVGGQGPRVQGHVGRWQHVVRQ